MAFGLKIWNAQNQVVIDSELPVFVEARRGAMANNGIVRGAVGLYRFKLAGGAITDDNEILGFMPNIGDFVSINPVTDPGDLSSSYASGYYILDDFCSNAPTLPYVVFKDISTLPAPTGYGMACYDASGHCTWSSDNLVFSVKNTGVFTAGESSSALFQSSPVTGGNCFFATQGGFNWFQMQSDLRAMCGRRTAANTYVFEKRPIIRDSGFPNHVNMRDFNSGLRYMIGKVT